MLEQRAHSGRRRRIVLGRLRPLLRERLAAAPRMRRRLRTV